MGQYMTVFPIEFSPKPSFYSRLAWIGGGIEAAQCRLDAL